MAKVSVCARRVCVEAMESRLFCDASQLTQVVAVPGLANVTTTSAKAGVASVTVTNPGAALKESVQVSVYASTTPITAGALGQFKLGIKKTKLNLATGASANVKVPLKVKKGGLPAGTYTLYAVVTDAAKAISVAPTGASLTVTDPNAGSGGGGTGLAGFKTTFTNVKVSNSLQGSADTQTFKVTMSFANTTAATVHDPLTISTYFSSSRTFALSTAALLGQSAYTLSAKPHAKVVANLAPFSKTFFISNDGVALLQGYITAVITDASSASVTASYPKLVFIDG